MTRSSSPPLDRFMELHALLERHAAQSVRRYVACKDDDRDLAMRDLPQFRSGPQPIHFIRQIEVRKNKVGLNSASRHQFQRGDTIIRRHHAMPIFLNSPLILTS
jgi:hypothetical protein